MNINYAGAINTPQDDVLRQESMGYTINPMAEPAEFASVADAQAVINDLDQTVYRLSEGEAGRPDYTVLFWLTGKDDDNIAKFYIDIDGDIHDTKKEAEVTGYVATIAVHGFYPGSLNDMRQRALAEYSTALSTTLGI